MEKWVMSGNSPIPNVVTAKAALMNQIVKDAQDLPSLLQRLSEVDPELTQRLEGKALSSSKTPWVTLIATGVAWVSTKYGLGWDETTDNIITGAVLVGVAYLMRAISPAPITSVFKKKENDVANVVKSAALKGVVVLVLGTGLLWGLTGCNKPLTPAQVQTAQTLVTVASATVPGGAQALADGQLLCQGVAGIQAIVDATTGKPYLVTGKPAAVVAQVCALLSGVPVAPPAAPITVQPAAVIPPAHT